MEFLDPKKRRAHTIRLFIGYGLISIALMLTTIILLYQAYGFGLKNGEVIQNGLIFMSSSPNPADITIDGKKYKDSTNTRILIPAGQYTFSLTRAGYNPWKRSIALEGGALIRFDYPKLFPSKLVTTSLKSYDVKPSLVTGSLDRRWLLVQANPTYNVFDVYDLSLTQPTSSSITLPDNIVTLKDGVHSWKVVQWSGDNRHVLLQHTTVNKNITASEYILLDRQAPDQSRNLTTAFGQHEKIEMRDGKYDKYYVYDVGSRVLMTATLDAPQPVQYLDHVLTYKSYGDKDMLYVTDKNMPAGKVEVKLLQGGKNSDIRQLKASSNYMLEIAQYSGNWIVVVGSDVEAKTYVYQNPAQALAESPTAPLTPIYILKLAAPNHVSFSANTRFVAVQGAQKFAVYDIKSDKGYTFAKGPHLDSAAGFASWMDGDRLTYVSAGKVEVFEFDNANKATLSAADPAYLPAFDRDYKKLLTVAPSATDSTKFDLASTALLAPQDQ